VPLVARTARQDKVRELQRTLYRAAKAEPGRRFHALHDKVYRSDVLERAWELVRANRGAAGIDKQTIAEVEEHGIAQLLDELAADLKAGRWRPLPARRVFIPKPGRQERRPLSIPTVRDRVVQAAVKIVIEPIFEADMLECSFGFRPGRSAHDALQIVVDESWSGSRWVAESDIANCFEAIPHEGLMSAIEERIVDRHVLKLLRAMLRAGVLEDGSVKRTGSGTPQGGVISPVLCNVYLHRLDRQWVGRGTGVLIRYADDLLVMCKTKQEAEDALVALLTILGELGLALKARQDEDRGPARRRRRIRLPWLPSPLRARQHAPVAAPHVPGPLALAPGDAACPPARSGDHRTRTAAAPRRGDRPGPQPVPGRLGGLLPLRKLRPVLRQDLAPRHQPVGDLRRQPLPA
jgi:group II intron reverse transcriptase/maturase